jgi:hypothetical protein
MYKVELRKSLISSGRSHRHSVRVCRDGVQVSQTKSISPTQIIDMSIVMGYTAVVDMSITMALVKAHVEEVCHTWVVATWQPVQRLGNRGD